MSSANKTRHLKLNQWEGSDIPQRTDFVSDNDIIDREIYNHTSDYTIHVTQDEKNEWTNFYHKFSYTGDGASQKTISSNCPFIPTWGIVFANSYTPSVVDFTNSGNYNYFAVFSNTGSNTGVSIANGADLKVIQSSTAVQKTEYRNYNQNGVIYTVIMFR